MAQEKEVEDFMRKVDKVVKENKLDLSSDEDLSIGIMNLISIEEHLFFTAQKTGKDSYLTLLNEVREIRKVMLKKIIKEYEGEVWCISKHLLAASMRLMEVGTKALNKGDMNGAKELFAKSYDLYTLFWAVNLGMKEGKGKADVKQVVSESLKENYTTKDLPPAEESKPGFLAKMREVVKKAVDCCLE